MLLDNEIDFDAPRGITRTDYNFETPPEVQAEIERDRESKEADFRRWLVKNKPKGAIMTPIETSTAVGVPDVFCCYNGFSSWIECKVILSGAPRFRGTQYSYLKKLVEAGGHAKIVIQRLNPNTYKPASIYIYDAERIVTIPSDMFKVHGQDMLFPQEAEPYYIWNYNKNKGTTIEDLYERLLVDTEDFAW